VGVRAAAKVLTPLVPGHVLRRKLEEPEALAALAEEDPPALLAVVLKSYDGPRTAAEIRRALSGVVAESRWSSWWATARKHPQVVADTSGRQSYSWAETSGDALDSVWRSFAAAEPRKQIDLLRRDGERDPRLKDRMQQALTSTAAGVVDEEPGLAVEIYYALEKSGGAPEEAPWAPAALLAPGGPAPLAVITGIQDRAAREAAYDELRRQRQDWPKQFADALAREEDSRLLDRLGSALEETDPEALSRFFDGALSQPHKAPAAFTWLAERAAAEPELRQRNPLRLLQQVLTALMRDELAPYRQRLLALAGHGGTLPRLLGDLNEEQAAAAEGAIERAGTLEPYQRDDLVKALHLRFPSLRSDDHASAPLYALPASLAAKQAELARLLKEEIPANRLAIEEARALGDLRENFEYKSARQRHEYLTARATELKDQLGRARPIDLAHTDPGQVRVGTVVTLEGDGGERRFTLLGPWESDPDAGIISYESELGQALLEKKAGDRLEVAGESHTVAAIEVFAPDAG
jgi:transcription elongation GreA/GreB family factor